MATVNFDTLKFVERTRRDIAEIKADTIKWVAGLLLAQGAVVAALVKLF